MTVIRVPATAAACACCAQAWAQAGPTGGMSGANPAYLLLQALVSLAIVVGLIYLAYLGLRHLSRKQLGVSDEGPVKVIQARHLGGDKWLYLVSVGKRRLLVGGGPSGVQRIADLGEAEEPADDDL